MEGKIIIISAPSGCGKSTIIKALMERGNFEAEFSVSATNRPPRPGEKHGVNYYFLTDSEFHNHIEACDFVEYEEVYPGRFYGTLKSEIDRRIEGGQNIILDIDVKGALNVKRLYGSKAVAIFIEPPSIDALSERLTSRGTENAETLKARLDRAEYEITFAPQFDYTVVNDNLEQAIDDTEKIITDFIDNTDK